MKRDHALHQAVISALSALVHQQQAISAMQGIINTPKGEDRKAANDIIDKNLKKSLDILKNTLELLGKEYE